MKMNEILQEIQSLARSQGFYGRLYRNLIEYRDNDPESYEAITEMLESQHFNSPVDMVLFFEC